jgi:NAD(P)-dependent dehydrogenase (short-subunit alcohol dehydrogenase family)
MPNKIKNLFRLDGKVAVITGGAGLLGRRHAEAVAAAGGTAILADLNEDAAHASAAKLAKRYGKRVAGQACDITVAASVRRLRDRLLDRHGRVDILINNAANNPQIGAGAAPGWARFENFPLDIWQKDIAVGLTGAMLCSQVFGTDMAKRGGGVILNISSDLGLIGPDQRIYRCKGLAKDKQPVKPVTYSAVKAGLIGLTRYCATYWAESGVRVNALCPGGVDAGQPEDFKKRLQALIPMGRMARPDEYQGAVLFLISDASSYMTGAVVSADGGRTCW